MLGAWNVLSPDFIAQEEIRFHPTAQRYEPGVLNASGIVGLKAVLEMLAEVGPDAIAARLHELKAHLVGGLDALGCEITGPREGAASSAITTFTPPPGNAGAGEIFDALSQAGIIASHRKDRAGLDFVRLSPHFYNTEAELDRTLEVIGKTIRRGA